MTTPTAVFLDTSILAGQQFNFSSNSLITFIPVAKTYNLAFLLPDPTEREVLRQINQRSKEALDALNDARKKAPFLHKWDGFPKKADLHIDNWRVARVARQEWNFFLGNFKVLRLGYDNLNIVEVMDWYDKCEPPFKEGKKRKEFPDAFAVSILRQFAQKNNVVIAVVSEDRDFKEACLKSTDLLYFPTLPRLTELLLSSDHQLEIIQGRINENLNELETSIIHELDKANYSHEATSVDVRSSDVCNLWVEEFSIVAIGDSEFTVSFTASFEVEHVLEWDEYVPNFDDVCRQTASVHQMHDLSGIAKVGIPSDGRSNSIEVLSLTLDTTEFEISSNFYD